MTYKELDHLIGFDPDSVREIFGGRAKIARIITKNCFPDAHREGDWARAGGESWYSVANISTGWLGSQIPVAIKAIISTCGCRDRTQREVDRLVRLYPHAPKVYALAPCAIVKEWLVPDRSSKNDEQLYRDLVAFMGQAGIVLANSRIQSAAMISGGRAKVFDAGWDIFD